MTRFKIIIYLLSVIILNSCEKHSSYNYAIKDFRSSLRPHLTKIISKGEVVFYDSALNHIATDRELIKLGQSEHPILRASAYREMLHRKSFNHFDILMKHLDDTAIVPIDGGEWGILYRTVSDDIIEAAKWKNNEDKNKTIDEVIQKHNYLISAYSILLTIDPKEKYYKFIKEMTLRDRKSIVPYNKPWNGDFEFAAYGLAKFKRKEDIQVIKNLLISHSWSMHQISFNLLKEFPDTAYMEVYEKYYSRHFYNAICRYDNSTSAIDFINSVATYKNERSAKILASILDRKPFVNCEADTGWLKQELIYAIWNNSCEAYLKLRKQVESTVMNYEKRKLNLEPFKSDIVEIENESGEKISW